MAGLGEARHGKAFQGKEFSMKFQKSSDTLILESVLSEIEVGELATYERLSKAIGRDVRKFAFSSLRSARKSVLKDKGIVFGVEVGEGIRRLTDAEIVSSTDSDRKRVSRAAKRSVQKLTCVDFAGLTDDQKRKHISASAQLGTVVMFTSSQATKKIEKEVANGKTETFAIGQTLKLFGGGD